MKQKVKNFVTETIVLMRNVPAIVFALFILAVFAMNLLANKSIDLSLDWLALDCGIIVSWVAFLCMDVLTRYFGPKAATTLSVIAISINLLACLVMYLASLIPGTWGAFFDYGELGEINSALDGTFGGTWYVLLGSTVAFVVSAVVNNFLNFGIGKLFKKNPNGFLAYATRTYVSTAIAQMCDNLIFALIVSHFFFGWSIVQCLTCSATGMVAELAVEALFSPIGYRVIERWRKNNVGRQYFIYLEEAK